MQVCLYLFLFRILQGPSFTIQTVKANMNRTVLIQNVKKKCNVVFLYIES